MKKKITLWIKIKMFWFMIWNMEHWLIEKCHYCNSMMIDKIEGNDEEHIYHAKYKCLNCGATAKVIEKWNGKSEYRNGAITSRKEDAF